MMIGLGDGCVRYNQDDLAAALGVTQIYCQTSRQWQCNAFNSAYDGSGCLPQSVMQAIPPSYISSHGGTPPPPPPAGSTTVSAETGYVAPPSTPTPVANPYPNTIVVGNSGTPIVPTSPGQVAPNPSALVPIVNPVVPVAPITTSSSTVVTGAVDTSGTSGLPATIFGINSTYVLIGGAALLVLMMSGGRK